MLESVTLTVKVELGAGGEAEVGVPVISPVVLFNDKPEGSEPDETLQAKGDVPPVTARIWS